MSEKAYDPSLSPALNEIFHRLRDCEAALVKDDKRLKALEERVEVLDETRLHQSRVLAKKLAALTGRVDRNDKDLDDVGEHIRELINRDDKLTERVEKLERKSLRWDGYQQAQEEFNVRLLEIEEPSLFPVADTPEPERSSPTEDEELVWVETGSFPGHPSPTSPITGRQEMIDLINEEDYQDRLTEAEGLLKEWRAVQATGHLRLRTGRFLNQERSGDEHIQRRAAEGEGTLVAGDLDISNPNPSDADVAEPRRECTCDWEEIKTDFVELRPVPGCPIHDPHQPTGSREREAYLELLYEVDTKVPGESRHDTAKRWLRERRERDLNTPEMTDSDAILGESHE